MERTTVYLTPSIKARLASTAARLGVSEAQLVREALDRHLAAHEAPALVPVGRSADGGVAGRVDEALDELGFGRR